MCFFPISHYSFIKLIHCDFVHDYPTVTCFEFLLTLLWNLLRFIYFLNFYVNNLYTVLVRYATYLTNIKPLNFSSSLYSGNYYPYYTDKELRLEMFTQTLEPNRQYIQMHLSTQAPESLLFLKSDASLIKST